MCNSHMSYHCSVQWSHPISLFCDFYPNTITNNCCFLCIFNIIYSIRMITTSTLLTVATVIVQGFCIQLNISNTLNFLFQRPLTTHPDDEWKVSVLHCWQQWRGYVLILECESPNIKWQTYSFSILV